MEDESRRALIKTLGSGLRGDCVEDIIEKKEKILKEGPRPPFYTFLYSLIGR